MAFYLVASATLLVVQQTLSSHAEESKMCAAVAPEETKKLPDVFLSCDEPNVAFAENLKKEVEARCNLSVALDNDDSWEESDDLVDHMLSAKQMIVIATEHSNITAWIMDYSLDDSKLQKQQSMEQTLGCRFQRCCKPPTVDFRTSQKDGLNEFMIQLRINTGYRRFRKPGSIQLLRKIADAIFS